MTVNNQQPKGQQGSNNNNHQRQKKRYRHNNQNHNQHHNSGRGGGGNSMKAVSHALSWALRHAAPELNLRMTADGYCPVQDLIDHTHPKLKKVTSLESQIRPVVETNDKQRFRLELRPEVLFTGPQALQARQAGRGWTIIPLTPEQAAPMVLPPLPPDVAAAAASESLAAAIPEGLIWCVRANQGHSLEGINPEFLLQEIPAEELATLPVIVHGTFFDAWRQIQTAGGLSRMGRTHIHFASGLTKKGGGDGGVISGMRASCQVYIYVNAAKCAAAGIRFFRSDNGVLLTAGVGDQGMLPLEYISHVTDRNGSIMLDQRQQQIQGDNAQQQQQQQQQEGKEQD